MAAIMTKTPAGEDIVILSRAEYDDLVSAKEDSIDAAHALELIGRLDNGTETMLSPAQLEEFLAAPTPMAFWRKTRGYTQDFVASHVGIGQGYLSELESGKKSGDVTVLRKIATVLRVSLDELVPTE